MAKRGFALGFAALLLVSPVSYAVAADNALQVRQDEKPLLVIRFNQEQVYFSRALKQAVLNAENAKPGVVYKVVSLVPAKGVAKEHAKANLISVIDMIKELGVQPGRVHESTQSSSSLSAQEIKIYVE